MSLARTPSLDRRIRSDIETRIHLGEWLPGHRLPTELELQAQYGCARATVGKALSALASAGLVERRKKAGTFVAPGRAHAAVLTIPDIADVVAELGKVHRFSLLSRCIRNADSADPAEREFLADSRLLVLSGLHMAGDRPFAIEQRLINLARVPDAEAADFTTEAPGTWLLRHIPWTRARHRIVAVGCSLTNARLLDCHVGAPCLELSRWTWRDGDGVTFVTQTFPARNYELVAEFSPQSA